MTSVVQFAGGVVVFFGLLTSPKEVGKDCMERVKRVLFFLFCSECCLHGHILYNFGKLIILNSSHNIAV